MLRGCVGLEVVSFGVAGLHQGLSLLKFPSIFYLLAIHPHPLLAELDIS